MTHSGNRTKQGESLFDERCREAFRILSAMHEGALTPDEAVKEWRVRGEEAVDRAKQGESLFSAQEVERLLRKEWWFNHGHPYEALYGDDGEMQCTRCPADYRRQPLVELQMLVWIGRTARPEARDGSLCDHGCGREGLVEHADGRRLCLPCYSREVGIDASRNAWCDVCYPRGES